MCGGLYLLKILPLQFLDVLVYGANFKIRTGLLRLKQGAGAIPFIALLRVEDDA